MDQGSRWGFDWEEIVLLRSDGRHKGLILVSASTVQVERQRDDDDHSTTEGWSNKSWGCF